MLLCPQKVRPDSPSLDVPTLSKSLATPLVSLSFKGQATKQATVKWPTGWSTGGFHMTLSPPCWCTEQKKKNSLGIRLHYHDNHHLRLFCAPTWPSYHVIENNQFKYIMIAQSGSSKSVPMASLGSPAESGWSLC